MPPTRTSARLASRASNPPPPPPPTSIQTMLVLKPTKRRAAVTKLKPVPKPALRKPIVPEEPVHSIPIAIVSTDDNNTILQQAVTHLLRVAPALHSLISRFECTPFTSTGLATHVDPFAALASGIISQQVSGAAAVAIKRKFLTLFPTLPTTSFPIPAQVLQLDVATLRTAGLSVRKAEYMHSLALAFQAGDLLFGDDVSDEEITERLVKVRGIGRWSAEMFLVFALKRRDVFSTGDLGVQRGVAQFCYGRDVKKLQKNKEGKGGRGGGGGKWKYATEKEMLEAAEKFRPYRSVFMWYMWRVGEATVDAMEGTNEEQR